MIRLIYMIFLVKGQLLVLYKQIKTTCKDLLQNNPAGQMRIKPMVRGQQVKHGCPGVDNR